MILDDASLSRIALGIASAVGVLLAIIVAILLSTLDRLDASGRRAIQLVRENAGPVARVLTDGLRSKTVSRTYFGDVEREFLADFANRLSGLEYVQSNLQISEWVSLTPPVLQTIRSNHARINDFAPAVGEFHHSFARAMNSLNEAIQENQVFLHRSSTAANLGITGSLAALVLVVALITGLAAEVRLGSGVSDTWNIVLAVSLIAGILVFLGFLVQAMRSAVSSLFRGRQPP